MMDSNITSSHNWRSPKIILALIGMLLLAGIVVVSILRDRIVNPPLWQVSVIGQGKIKYQPDIATVLLGVQVERVTTAQSALNQLNSKMEKIIAEIKKLGITDQDIQTQTYSLYPQYDYIDNVSTFAGYTASQQLSVKIKDLKTDSKLISNIIANATQAGANVVNGITFDISNAEELKQQARIAAINDAKQKAGSLADAAGVKLKRVVGWWENVIQAPNTPIPYYDGKGGIGGGGSSGTVPTGQQEIIIEVNLSYQIK